MANILVVDDERSIRGTLKELLELEGYALEVASDGAEALKYVAKKRPDLVISDIKMEGVDGMELLAALVDKYPEIQVIMMSGHGTIDLAVEAMHRGALDFIEKPIEMNRLLVSVRNALDHGKLKEENKVLRRKAAAPAVGYEIIGHSEAIDKVKAMIAKVAPADSRVLITGSNGTGKELVARQLHLQSPRSIAPFIEVNCAAIPSELIESALFGHEKGAFTSAIKQQRGKFEQAQGGTIFLDEIGDMSLAAQAKVLRALQEKKISRVGSDADISVDVRVVAATNKDLDQEIKQGRFREDLFHRLAVIKIHLPSLADRKGDIPLLVDHFLRQLSVEQSCAVMQIEPAALELLSAQEFRGNIRELRNVVERLTILCDGQRITAGDVRQYL